ncbi:translation initiation factor IF-2-like [Hippocampus zosterae]|uniref:translation initiation factor IF-2-like n=1 Tax=Hippocampus zosterae TaxID=109293 RepID=UPI00223DB819|nr:translation initiation factor IF-2-like [Hippocampus zosterae]
MPSKRKKNQRRMRRVQKERQALEEKNSCSSPAKPSPAVAPKEPKKTNKGGAKVQPEVAKRAPAQVRPAVPEPVPSDKALGEATPEPQPASQIKCKVLALEPAADASQPFSAAEPKPAAGQKVEPKSTQEVVSAAPESKTVTEEINPVEQVVTRVPELVSCTFNSQPITETGPAAKVEPKSGEQVGASVPQTLSCTLNSEKVINAEPALRAESDMVKQVVASVSELDPKPEQVAIQKMSEEVICCTFAPQPVVEAKLALKVESESIDHVIASVPKLIGCTSDSESLKPSGVSEQTEAREIPEPGLKKSPKPEPVAGGQQTAEQVFGCSLDPEPVVEPEEDRVPVPKPAVVARIPQPEPEPKAEAKPVAVNAETELVEIHEDAAPSTQCPSEESNIASHQMQLESTMNGHLLPKVSKEG